MNRERQELQHSFSTDVSSRSSVAEPVIVREIRKLSDIDSRTISKAIENYYQYSDQCNSRSPRGNKQTYWIFACLYRAYIDQDIYITPRGVATLCGLDFKNIERALNTVPIIIDIKPIQLIQYYLNEMHAQGLIDNSATHFAEIDIIHRRIANSIFGDEIMNDYPARNIAIGIITYYFDSMVFNTKIT